MKQFFTLSLVVLLLAGCATISSNKRDRLLEETILLYEKSIRWGDFAKARYFQRLASGHQDAAPPKQDIRVAGYHRQQTRTLDDENRVGITVRIDYYHNDTLTLNKLTDEQVWEYSPEDEAWFITTPLPAFR